ncbi:MAG: L-threonylcarbamoyladenylate synthase [Candidatus Saccharimonadales bacterium]
MEIDTANKLLEPGCIAVIPTDTVYGLVARAEDKSSVKRLYDLKNREQKPGTIIAANIKQLETLGLKHRYLKAVEQYWPGPISVIIPVSNPELEYLHLGKLSLAVRIPDDEKLIGVLLKTGPLLTSSANLPGKKPAETIKVASEYFGQEVDFYEDGGDLSARKPSTLIRVIDDAVDVLRQGAGEI